MHITQKLFDVFPRSMRWVCHFDTVSGYWQNNVGHRPFASSNILLREHLDMLHPVYEPMLHRGEYYPHDEFVLITHFMVVVFNMCVFQLIHELTVISMYVKKEMCVRMYKISSDKFSTWVFFLASCGRCVHLFIHICMYIYICTFEHVYIYIYIYIHVQIMQTIRTSARTCIHIQDIMLIHLPSCKSVTYEPRCVHICMCGYMHITFS